jgi:uncharacterized protein YgiM (DUF1202 family)
MKSKLLITFLCLLVLVSCSLPVGFSPTLTTEPGPPLPPPPTETIAVPTATPEPTSTPTAAPTATTIVYVEKVVKVSVDVLNMRYGPSEFFDIVKRITKDSTLYILGRSQGDDWFMVRDSSNMVGWVASTYIQYTGSLLAIPIFTPKNALEVSGRVIDQQENPIPGINLAVYTGMGTGSPNSVRTDVYTDSTGEFHAYLPDTFTGPLTIEIVGYLCTSPIMDANCKITGKFSTDAFSIYLPDDADTPYVFQFTK